MVSAVSPWCSCDLCDVLLFGFLMVSLPKMQDTTFVQSLNIRSEM